MYTHRKIIKAPLLHQSLGPHVFFVSLSLSLPGWFSGAWRPVVLTFLPGLLRPSWEGTLCLHPLERAPDAFVSNAGPVSSALLVLCINQGISASFCLLLSYRWLHTTRFRSIKGPQHSTTIRKHRFFSTQPSLWSSSHIHMWILEKPSTMWTFVGKVMSLLFITLARFVITFLPRSKCLFISWWQSHLQWVWSPKIKCHCFHFFPFYLPWWPCTAWLIASSSFASPFTMTRLWSMKGRVTV